MESACGLMQPSRESAARIRTNGFRRCLRPRGVMGGAIPSFNQTSVVKSGSGSLVTVVDLLGVNDRGVVASGHDHIERVTDRRGLAIRASCTLRANSGGGVLHA